MPEASRAMTRIAEPSSLQSKESDQSLRDCATILDEPIQGLDLRLEDRIGVETRPGSAEMAFKHARSDPG
jgi:hypothetical protein